MLFVPVLQCWRACVRAVRRKVGVRVEFDLLVTVRPRLAFQKQQSFNMLACCNNNVRPAVDLDLRFEADSRFRFACKSRGDATKSRFVRFYRHFIKQ